MAGVREEQVENHWPGYVDALTTMLMVLTFVMMILGIAVFAMSQNTSRILLEQIAKAARIELPTGAEAPVADLADRILKELERPKAASPGQGGVEHDGVEPGQTGQATTRQGQTGQGTTGHRETGPSEHRPGEHGPGEHGPGEAARQPGAGSAARIVSNQPAHAAAPASASLGAQTADALIITFQPRATRLDDAALRDLDGAIRAAQALTAAGGARLLARVDAGGGAVSDARRVAFYRAMLLRSRLIEAGLPAEAIRIRLVEQPDDGVAPESVRIEPARRDAPRPDNPQP
jgi:hypothetical protein